MNENLNLVEILKDCPKGTKLYSTAFGDVYFYGISDNKEYPICIAVAGNSDYRTLTYDGKLWRDYGGECILFPSREQRDWSKFNPKKDWFVPPCEFKDGDILSYQTVRFATEEEKQKLFEAIKDNGYEWNAETKTLKKLVKPKPKFKVGDKIVNRVNMYMGDLSHQSVISEITEDKYILNDGGYIHFKNQDIWALATDKKQRFDPKTLHTFDRVLVRLTKDCIWNATFFSHYDEEVNWGCHPCVTISCKSYDKCIPYNDETKHLLGTSDEAPEYYRYWED